MNKSFLLVTCMVIAVFSQTAIDTTKILEEYSLKNDTNSIEYLREKQIELRTSNFIDDSSELNDSLAKKLKYSELDEEPIYRISLDKKDSTEKLQIFGHIFLQNLMYDMQSDVTKKVDQKSGKLVDDTVVSYTLKNKDFQNNAPVNSGYRLGTGDEVVISIWGDVQQTFSLFIDRSGAIAVPSVGQVIVAGLSLQETKEILIKKLSRVFSGIRYGNKNATTFVDVSMGRIRGKSVVVAGNVTNPGTHIIPATGGIIAAIAAAGGPLETGSIREILVQHGGAQNDTVDLYSYLLTGKLNDTVHVADYDVIIIPPATRRVALTGAVVRPAYYDLLPEDNFSSLLQIASGFSVEAYTGNISLLRTTQNKVRESVFFSYEQDKEKPLQSNDSLFVPFVFQEQNEIVVEGSVKQPGSFGYTEGLMLYDVIMMAGGVTEDFFPDRLEILRTHKDLKKEIFSVNVDALLASKGAQENIALQKRDIIKVYSVWDLDSREYVVIRGEVKKPGKYFLRQGMTVQDLILLAGGISEFAYKDTIEVSRISDENKLNGNSTQSNKISVSIDFFKKSEFPLQHKDNVFIRTNSSYKDQAVVVLKGEFSYPGPYAKQTENETLSSLIERAGGIKTSAYLEGAIFIRGKDSIGVVSINLKKLLDRGRSKDDIILEDGDTLYLPTVPKTVMVQGHVNYPTAVKYVDGKNVGYYLKRAGGFRTNADKGSVYSILANGAVKNVAKCSKHVNAGTTIVVPEAEKRERDPKVGIAIVQGLVAIAASITTLAIVLIDR